MAGMFEKAQEMTRSVAEAFALKDAENWYGIFQQRLSKTPNNKSFQSTAPEEIVRKNVERKISDNGLEWPKDERLQKWIIMKVLTKSAISGGGSTIPDSQVWDPVVVGDAIEGFGPFRFGTLQDELVIPEEIRAKLNPTPKSTN